MKEYYARLYLNDNASEEEVKRAHKKLVKKFHPDKNIDNNEFVEEFKIIQDAYEKLIAHFIGQPIKPEYKKNTPPTPPDNFTSPDKEETSTDFSKNDPENHVGDFSYEIGEYYYSQTVGKGFAIHVADGIYLIIKLSLTNITKKTQLIEDTMFKLIDNENYQFETSINGTNGLLMSRTKTFGVYAKDCHPDIPTNGYVVFEVPKTTDYSLVLASGWQTKTIPLVNIKTLIETDNQKEEIKTKETINQTSKEQSPFGVASIEPEKGTTKFNCGICKKPFYADRTKNDVVICPYCKAKNTIPKTKETKKGCAGIIALIIIFGSSLFSLYFLIVR